MVEGSKTKEDAPEGRKGEEMRGRGGGGRIRRNCRARVARNTDVSLAERCILSVVSTVLFQKYRACPVVSVLKLTIHFPLICQDDFSPAARWVDGQGLLKALVNLRGPHPVRFDSDNLLVVLQ